MKQDYYVYIHRNPTTKEIFYVGKGRAGRAYSIGGRSKQWMGYVKEHGKEVELLYNDLTEKEAFNLEHILFSYFPNLLNKRLIKHIVENNLSEWSGHFYYDETSPSCLRWATNRYSGRNKLLLKYPIGSVAGSLNGDGYWCVRINGKNLLVHRIIYYLHNGIIPEGLVINHKDCNRRNSKISNLEAITSQKNNRRKTLHKIGVDVGVIEAKNNVKGKDYFRALATWCDENSKMRSKGFGYLKYGKETAWKLAREYRKQKVEEIDLILEGIQHGY